jgi:hypothetical protein
MSFVLFCFHLFVFVIILSRTQMAAAFHDGCWCFKSCLVFAGYVASMWISNDFMQGYLIMAQWLSAMYLVYQGLLMLIVAYKVNDTLFQNYKDDDSGCSGCILLGAFVVITCVNIYWII